MAWQEFSKFYDLVSTENDLGIKVGVVDTPNKLSAYTARGKHIQLPIFLVSPYTNDTTYLVFPVRYHCGDGASFGT